MNDLTFFNVNEEGDVYGVEQTLEAALPQLTEFPNDTIVIAWADSPAGLDMMANRL